MPDRRVHIQHGGGLGSQRLTRQQLPAKLEPGGAESICQKAEVTDTHETSGQDVEEEPAQELRRGQCHQALLVAVGVVLPAEGDALPVKDQESMVGDGDAMSVAAQVTENLPCASEGRLGIHHPVLAMQLAQQLAKLLLLGQWGTGSHAT